MNAVTAIVGVVVAALLIGALAGTIFSSFNTSSLGNDAPSWASTAFIAIAGVVLLVVFLRSGGLLKGG
jgi:hypothetical protein